MRTGRLFFCALLMAAFAAGGPRAAERFNRGLVVVVNDAGQAYVGWRLLTDDEPGVAFNVYRRTAGATPVKVNAQPITTSTNLVDTTAPMDRENTWFVRAVADGRELAPSESASLAAHSPPNRVRIIKLQGDSG